MFDKEIKIIIIYILKDNSKIYYISTKRIVVNYKQTNKNKIIHWWMMMDTNNAMRAKRQSCEHQKRRKNK